MSEAGTAFVTGATGFIGTRLVHELARRGQRVRALTRRETPDAPPPSSEPPMDFSDERIELVRGDILDRDSLKRGMEGCTHVYHVAGYAKNWAPDPNHFRRVNVDGTCNVLDTAREFDVQRVVWTSTVMTIGVTQPGEVADEDSSRAGRPLYTEYEVSKMEAEEKARQYVHEGLSVVAVNPTRVFGPGHLTEGNSLTQIIDDYDRGKAPVLLNCGRNVGNYVFVDDVVQGHLLAMEKGRDGERYLLGGENLKLRRFFEIIDEVSGKKHFQIPIRRPGAMIFAYFHLCRAKLFGAYPLITPPWMRTFLSDCAISIEKAERELGYQATPMEEAIGRTYRWLLEVRERAG